MPTAKSLARGTSEASKMVFILFQVHSGFYTYTNLETIWCYYSENITGDIKHLINLPNLNIFHLGFTNIYGNISVFSNNTVLKHISVHGTSVSGNVSAFANCVNLEELYFANTQIVGYPYQFYSSIIGDISNLARLNKLTDLYIDGQSQVYGDISVFRNMTGLKRLFVNNTNKPGRDYTIL